MATKQSHPKFSSEVKETCAALEAPTYNNLSIVGGCTCEYWNGAKSSLRTYIDGKDHVALGELIEDCGQKMNERQFKMFCGIVYSELNSSIYAKFVK
jgi:hypothetical protein